MCSHVPANTYGLLQEVLAEGLPIESHFLTRLLHDYFLAEIAVKTIEQERCYGKRLRLLFMFLHCVYVLPLRIF